MKLSEREITLHRVNLFNKCVRENVYPNLLKLAKIAPVFKMKEQNLISNYGPVAVLTNLCKILESNMFDRLNSFYFQKMENLSQNHYGFRKQRRTELAVFKLVERFLATLDDKFYSICVFLVFTACLDTINRSLPFKKIERYDVRDMVISLFKYHLEGQKQYPNILKLAKIAPVCKKKEQNLISNYGPVAVLTNLCKILESNMFDRLNSFYFQKMENLSQNHYGFRKQRRTELAVFTLVDRFLATLDDKFYSICVFLGFSACLDTINRSFRSKKLKDMV